ncbi:MAG: acyloxyacyl hydrolase [Phycisphaerae bacterium]|nr:acyloxyacyl hydrolase [Phycisphaerae bacterium]
MFRPASSVRIRVAATVAALLLPAAASPAFVAPDEAPLRLDLASALATQPAEPPPQAAAAPRFGEPGPWFLTLGGGAAFDFEDSTDGNLFVGFSTFLARELEFQIELGAWYFNQPGDDTGGLSASLVARWHLLHADDFDWTVYLDAGIGVLGAFDETPPGGTSFNFLPRLGAGFTKAIDGTPARLQVGLRWHHISNARINGDDNNPARNGLMVYAGVIFPF